MVKVILILQLAFPPLAGASRADDYIQATHHQAKAQIDGRFNELLLSSVFSLLQADVSGRGQDLSQRLDLVERSIVRHRRLLENQSPLTAAESVKLSAQEVEQISNDFEDTLIHLKTDRMFVRDLENEAVRAQVALRGAAEKFLSNLRSVCDAGLDAKTQIDLLPVVRPLTPHFEFHVEHTVSGDATSPTNDRSHFSVGASQEEVALWASAIPVGMIVIASALKGELLLTASAMMAKGVFVQAFAGATLGVAAIAAVVIAVKLLAAQNESVKHVKAQRRMFEKRATVEDARHYSKELCRSTYAEVSNLPDELDALAAGDVHAEARVEAERGRNEAFVAEFVPAFEALRLKREELEKAEELKPAEKMQGEVERVIEVGRQMTPTRLAQLIRFQFLNTFKQARTESKIIIERLGALADDAYMRNLDQRNRELRHLARAQNERALSSTTVRAWSTQIESDPELRLLSRDLDRLVLRYAAGLSTPHSDPEALAGEVRAWKARYARWRDRLRETSAAGDALGAEARLLERHGKAL